MDEKQAIITEDKKIKCPVCGKTNGIANDGAFVRGYIIRCRSSKRNHEHSFILNIGEGLEND